MDINYTCEYSGLPSLQSYEKNNEMKNFNEWMRVNDTPENAEKYFHYTDEDMFNEYQNELKGAGAGGESIKENFIDSAQSALISSSKDETLDKIYEKLDKDFMYNWIKHHKNRK